MLFWPWKVQPPTDADILKFDGITVKNIPKNIEDGEIYDFLCDNGMPDDIALQQISINHGEKNTWVMINELSSEQVQSIFQSIHYPESEILHFETRLYCKRLRNYSPLKATHSSDTSKQANSMLISAPSDSERPQIPGLPEKIRKKGLKNKKKAKNLSEKAVEKSSDNKHYYLKVPQVKKTVEADLLSQFQFSDYSDSSDDDSDQEFADSKEALSEVDTPGKMDDQSTSTPALKRPLRSPEEVSQAKKFQKGISTIQKSS